MWITIFTHPSVLFRMSLQQPFHASYFPLIVSKSRPLDDSAVLQSIMADTSEAVSYAERINFVSGFRFIGLTHCTDADVKNSKTFSITRTQFPKTRTQRLDIQVIWRRN